MCVLAGAVLVVVCVLPSEPLDVGTTTRLFTPALRQAVYLRDKGCTFPGCTMPASWTDLHHVIHWIFGGVTGPSPSPTPDGGSQARHQVDSDVVEAVHDQIGQREGVGGGWEGFVGDGDDAHPGGRG